MLPNTLRLTKNTLEKICEDCHYWAPFQYHRFYVQYPNLLSLSHHQWQEIRKELFSKYPLHIAHHLYKSLRKERYQKMIEYDWESKFSAWEKEWIWYQIREHSNDEPCVDNFRAADKSNKKQVKRFWKQARKGCCGSANFEAFRWWGLKIYLIGYNYGH